MEKFDLVLNTSPVNCLPFMTGCNTQSYRMASNTSIVKQIESDGLIACDVPLDTFLYFFREYSDIFHFWQNYSIDFTVRLRLNDYIPTAGLEIPLIMFAQSSGSVENSSFIFGVYFVDSVTFKFFYAYRTYFSGSITKVYGNHSYAVTLLNVPNRFILSHNGNYVLYWNQTLLDFTFSGTYPGYNPYVFGYRGMLRFGNNANISSTASLRYFSFSMYPCYVFSSGSQEEKINDLHNFLSNVVKVNNDGSFDYTKMFPFQSLGSNPVTLYLLEELRQLLNYNIDRS